MHIRARFKERALSRVGRGESPILKSLDGKAIIDEVQNVPELLSQIQVTVDEFPAHRYILTGSSNFSLLQTVTQSLAGRAALFTLLPFSLREVEEWAQESSINRIMYTGLYPATVVKDTPPQLFYRNYYNTYVERDLRNFLKIKNLLAFDTFIRLLAARAGSEINASNLAREAGVSTVTINEWLSILTTSYIVFPLRPYFTNVSKQLTKMPKVYFYDTGLLCHLLGIEEAEQLEGYNGKGGIFENLAICELMKKSYNAGKDSRVNYYREKNGREVDAVVGNGPSLSLYEIKLGETLKPEYLVNMKEAEKAIPGVESRTVIYNGRSLPPQALNIRDV